MGIRGMVTGQNESGKSAIMRNTPIAKLTIWFFRKIFPKGKVRIAAYLLVI